MKLVGPAYQPVLQNPTYEATPRAPAAEPAQLPATPPGAPCMVGPLHQPAGVSVEKPTPQSALPTAPAQIGPGASVPR